MPRKKDFADREFVNLDDTPFVPVYEEESIARQRAKLEFVKRGREMIDELKAKKVRPVKWKAGVL